MIANAWSLSTAQIAIGSAAILAFAISGLLAAARKQLDAVGVCIVVGFSAFGGGTLRDVLLDRRPFFWVEHSVWLWVLLGLSVLAMFFLQARHFAPTERAMQWPDASASAPSVAPPSVGKCVGEERPRGRPPRGAPRCAGPRASSN